MGSCLTLGTRRLCRLKDPRDSDEFLPTTPISLRFTAKARPRTTHTTAHERLQKPTARPLKLLSRSLLTSNLPLPPPRAAARNSHSAPTTHLVTMKTPLATLGLAALASAATTSTTTETHITAAEWAVPTKNSDPYQCPLKNIPGFLTGGPSPSGALSSALISYEDKLYETCTPPATGIWEPCSVPPRSVLCAFSQAVPTSLLPAYSSYASSAASWWSSAGNGDAVVSLVKECPYLWYNSLLMNPGSGGNLNRTVAYAQCWAEAHPTGAGGGAAATGTSTKASTKPGATGGATPTPTSNGAFGSRAAATDAWMMAGSGMGVAAAMNVGLL